MLTKAEIKALRHLQYRRALVYLRVCRRYGVQPERMGCHTLWPDCVRNLHRQHRPPSNFTNS